MDTYRDGNMQIRDERLQQDEGAGLHTRYVRSPLRALVLRKLYHGCGHAQEDEADHVAHEVGQFATNETYYKYYA